MPTALITGANGFIGAVLTRRLAQDGWDVRALCRSRQRAESLADSGAEIVEGDVQLLSVLRQCMAGCEVAFHLAAVGHGSASYQYNINVNGTRNVVRAAHEAGVQRFVHVSSIAVYGYNLSGNIDESHPQRPPSRDFYMQTKMLGEQALWKYVERNGLPTVSVRPAFVYGPGGTMWSRNQYELCRRIGKITINGGTGNAHPIYVDDVVDLLVTAATHPEAPGKVFHAAPDPAPTWNEFMGHYARIAGTNRELSIELPSKQVLKPLANTVSLLARLVHQPFDLYGALQHITRHITYKMDRAATILGWRPKITLEEGMSRTEPWLKSLA